MQNRSELAERFNRNACFQAADAFGKVEVLP